eukprot:TRINITY_DN61585_c0_g1_i1.p1 TRINITY_DN61585_c0_g1~~TRINITY_DN61585_c0_g1_i1.p1  ORF type:complete len:408 (+),score=56.07 TRINITY_DN61585_c0_g1_i1:165-1388(+)
MSRTHYQFPEGCLESDDDDDKSESFADIMAQLDVSKSTACFRANEKQDTKIGFAERRQLPERNRREGNNVESHRSVTRRRPEAAVLRPVHPGPFGPGRGKGDFFGSPGSLPRKDLTSWEQERAICPERSWSRSSMTCVSKTEFHGSASSPSLGTIRQQASPTYLCDGEQRVSVPIRPNSRGNVARRIPQPCTRGMDMLEFQEEEEEEVLTPVRTRGSVAGMSSTQPLQADTLTLKPKDFAAAGVTPVSAVHKSRVCAAADNANIENFNGVAASRVPRAAFAADDAAIEAADKEEALKTRRRKLLAELCRTEHQLRDAANVRAEDASWQQTGTAWPELGGGGGAKPTTSTRQRQPSAGGPFAGKQATMNRHSASTWNQSVAQMAKTSYDYLGPKSNGPSQPEIHSLWS